MRTKEDIINNLKNTDQFKKLKTDIYDKDIDYLASLYHILVNELEHALNLKFKFKPNTNTLFFNDRFQIDDTFRPNIRINFSDINNKDSYSYGINLFSTFVLSKFTNKFIYREQASAYRVYNGAGSSEINQIFSNYMENDIIDFFKNNKTKVKELYTTMKALSPMLGFLNKNNSGITVGDIFDQNTYYTVPQIKNKLSSVKELFLLKHDEDISQQIEFLEKTLEIKRIRKIKDFQNSFFKL